MLFVGRDRITELRVRGMRSLENVVLPLTGLTVLTGENGSGKSSLIEAAELLRRATSPEFRTEVGTIHGGKFKLCRLGGNNRILLGVRVEGTGPTLDYDLDLEFESGGVYVVDETIARDGEVYFSRSKAIAMRRLESKRPDEIANITGAHLEAELGPAPLVAGQARLDDESIRADVDRLRRALRSIQVHLPFEVVPDWANQSVRRQPLGPRASSPLQSTSQVARFGENLASAFHALRNDFDNRRWDRAMALIRLGLGDGVERINVQAEGSGGHVSLALKYQGIDAPVPAATLSDGTLSYLACVATTQLVLARGETSLFVFDEPELHLHPALLLRVVGMLEEVAESTTTLVATHSDRFLDYLEDPASSVRVCELDEKRTTSVTTLDPAELERWIADYRGFGDLRAAGHQRAVLSEAPVPPES